MINIEQMNNNIKRFALLGVLIAFALGWAGCRVGREYQRPELQIPARYNDESPKDSSGIGQISWEVFFSDTTLQRLIDQGLQHNYDLQIALKHIAAAKQQVKQARVLGVPELTGSITAQTNNPSDKSLTGASIGSFPGGHHIDDYSAALSLSWEADIWGKIRNRKAATVAAYLQTKEAARAVRTRLIANIALGYYNLLMLDEQMSIAKENLVLRDSTLQLTRFLKQAGRVTRLATQQAKAQKQATVTLIHQLRMDIVLQEHALNILTGQMPDHIAGRPLFSRLQARDTLSAGVPALLLGRRPDVKAKEMALVAANAQAGIAHAEMYPSLNITASGGVNAFRASEWFNMPAALFGLLAGSVAQPVFQHRKLKTRWEVAKINREEAALAFRQSVLHAVGEVADVLVQIKELKQTQTVAASRVHTLELAVNNAQMLFKSGMADYLEVITAQQNALQAELNFSNVKRRRLSASVELYRALGGGWE